MNEQKHLPYGRQSISQEDIEAVSQALSKPIITRGELVETFEKTIASYVGAKYAVAFNSGSSALMAAYAAAETGAYDSILTTPNTFVATIGTGMQFGAKPIFIDIDRSTGNISIEQLSYNVDKPSSRGKKIITPVHFAGIPVDMEAIDRLISNPATIIIEDAAHALGSSYKDGSKVGSCSKSHMTVFSFHPVKHITTGEGGMVTTNDEDLFHKLQLFRNNGIERDPRYLLKEKTPWYYEVVSLTNNYNFTEIQAALGLSQFKRLDAFIAKRKKLLSHYAKKLVSLEHIHLLSSPPDVDVAPQMCVVKIDFGAYKTGRVHVMQELAKRGIGTQVHYIPIYRHPVFIKMLGDVSEYFPETETYYAQALTLPLYYELTIEDVDFVVSSLNHVLKSA